MKMCFNTLRMNYHSHNTDGDLHTSGKMGRCFTIYETTISIYPHNRTKVPVYRIYKVLGSEFQISTKRPVPSNSKPPTSEQVRVNDLPTALMRMYQLFLYQETRRFALNWNLAPRSKRCSKSLPYKYETSRSLKQEITYILLSAFVDQTKRTETNVSTSRYQERKRFVPNWTCLSFSAEINY